jgi:asparagine synthase (glutamine-hydrolysing)
MCGICGTFNAGTRRPVDPDVLDRMVDVMVHRGPDDRGVMTDADFGFGMRRLSIIDLEGGAQPICNEDGTIWVVLNGEIYNFRELRVQLESHGHVFRTRSDTEVVVHAYEQWGSGFLERLNGMFGLAVWDATSRALLLARDPFGIKPLYYCRPEGDVVFASEIRPLLLEGRVTPRVSRDALSLYVSLTYVPSPLTMFEGMYRLRPGHCLVCAADGSVEEVRFAGSDKPAERRWSNPTELLPELRSTIAAAVERQLVADVPVGVMLSGGVDSSAIAAIASPHYEGGIDAFTVGFGSDYQKDEVAVAREFARSIGARHHSVHLDEIDYMNSLEDSVLSLEEPIATTSAVAFRAICALARQHVKVVLTGQGADEPFAGYPRYLGLRYAQVYRSFPEGFRRHAIRPIAERLPRAERLKRAVRSLDEGSVSATLARVYSVVDGPVKEGLLVGSPSGDEVESSVAYWLGSRQDDSLLAACLYADSRLSLPDNLLLYGDKMSMAVSLEARVPFLDLELMALAEAIPAEWKISGWDLKHLWKRALEQWVPHETIARKKVGFETPVDEWFRHGLDGGIPELLELEGTGVADYLDPRAVARLVEEHRSGRHDHKRLLFSVLVFVVWYRLYIVGGWKERAPAPLTGLRGATDGQGPLS